MIILQFITAFIAVMAFSVNLEIPKKHIIYAGLVGAIGWITYLLCFKSGITDTMSYFISSLLVSILSLLLAKIFHTLTTIFLIPGILPIVPGAAMYKTVYALINNNTRDSGYYLFQVIFITIGIALAIYISETIKNIRFVKKEEKNRL